MSSNDALRERFEEFVAGYLAEEDAILQAIRIESEKAGLPEIQVKPLDGYLLQWLIYLINAKKVLEIGTLGGYSGTWIARALPEDGTLITLELEEKHAEVAQRNFTRAGVGDKVTIIQGKALDHLPTLETGIPFDFIFLDADKASYPQYLAWSVEHVRPGGVIAAHNVLRRGRIFNPPEDANDEGLLVFNDMLMTDSRLRAMMIPLGDGMGVAMRR
ncbi:MAG: O-methyltransferase [Anaerolineae bacterium]